MWLKQNKVLPVIVIATALAYIAWQVYGKVSVVSPLQQDIIVKSYDPIVQKAAVKPLYMLRQLTTQIQANCTNWKIFGPQWSEGDGGWPVCMAEAFLPKKPCTVYSFGINYDWSFDDVYRETYGCILRTFDPSMGRTAEHEHKPGVFFYPMGLSDRKEIDPRGWSMDSYKGFLTRFGDQDKIIPYLKFDVEASEWKVLDNMLSDGILKNVMQLGFEMHVPQAGNATKYFQLIKGLEAQGFRRWFCRDHHLRDPNFRLTTQIQANCTNWKVFGPHWSKYDGGWPVCMAKAFLPQKPCTVYSFGINYDWAFDEVYRETFGCTLRTFDPSMDNTAEHEHKPGVFFYPMGLSDKKETDVRGWSMDSYKGFLTRFGDQDVCISIGHSTI